MEIENLLEYGSIVAWWLEFFVANKANLSTAFVVPIHGLLKNGTE